MWRGLERWLGLVRSLIIYWRPGRQRGLRELYRPFVGAGDLAFDVGAHLGDRTAAFVALGRRVGLALDEKAAGGAIGILGVVLAALGGLWWPVVGESLRLGQSRQRKHALKRARARGARKKTQ